MSIVQDLEHSNGAPTIEGTGIRVKDVASAYEPDEITQLYPDLAPGGGRIGRAETDLTGTFIKD